MIIILTIAKVFYELLKTEKQRVMKRFIYFLYLKIIMGHAEFVDAMLKSAQKKGSAEPNINKEDPAVIEKKVKEIQEKIQKQ